MTPAQLTSYVRLKTKTNSTTFPDANILLLANMFIDDFAKEIIKVNEDYFGMPQTTNLVEDQREYSLPCELLNQIKFVEAKLDGTNWVALSELDLTTYHRPTNESEIVANFANGEGQAFFDIFRNSLWIYSGTIIDVEAGLKLWSLDFPAHLDDLTSTTDMSVDPSTTTHGFPRAFHELLCRRIVIEKKELGDKPIALTTHEQKFDTDFYRAIDSLRPANLDRAVKGELPATDDDDGYEL